MNNNLQRCINEEISNYLSPYINQLYKFDISNSYDLIEIHGQTNQDQFSRFILLRVSINHEYRQIYIPNIFLPEIMRYKGIGKKLISLIYKVAEEHGYELFIVDMTTSFYNRLIRRGALPCEEDDAVKIIEDTLLC